MYLRSLSTVDTYEPSRPHLDDLTTGAEKPAVGSLTDRSHQNSAYSKQLSTQGTTVHTEHNSANNTYSGS